MEERRKTPRLQEENEVTINIVSGEEDIAKEEMLYNSKDISVYGAKIQGNILLPIDTIIKIDITLNDLQQKITTIGKVKWNKFIIENGYYEAGVEFIDAPDEEIQKLHGQMQKDDAFISEGKWSKLQELNEYEITPEGDAFIPKEEWSRLQGVNKKEAVSIVEQIKTIETRGADMKNCRYCSREIKSDAVKCEYCGRTLSGERTDRKVFI
jgi:hypothetical protein